MQSGRVGTRPGAGAAELSPRESEYVDDKSSFATNRHGGNADVPVEEAVERYFIPEKYKTFRQFSWGFCIGRTIEQFYAEWSGKPGPVLNYS